MSGRLLVIGDVHGEYKMLCEVLKKASYNPEQDQLILLGDYIDRGPDSKKVVQKTKQLVKNGAIALKGNHEEMAFQYISKMKEKKRCVYFRNGGRKTINSYNDLNKFEEDIRWLNKLPCIKKIENKYIFVHAGIKPGIGPRKQSKRNLLWIRDDFFSYDWSKREFPETIVVGHTPFPEVRKLPGIITVDTGAGKGGVLSLLDLTNDNIYQATF